MSIGRMRFMVNHYFFRHGVGNQIFKKVYKFENNKLVLQKDKFKYMAEYIWLSIYYSDFKYSEYSKLKPKKDKKTNSIYELPQNYISQIKLFFESPKDSIYWIFLDEYLLAFEATNKIIDQEFLGEFGNEFLDDNLTRPKLRSFSFLKSFSRFDVPELFATTDSSNTRGTILRLNEKNKLQNLEIARALISDKKIKVNTAFEALRYLSPIQLETFFFKLFDSNDQFVTSCRGGSKYSIDIQILPDENNKELLKFFMMGPQGILLQIKRSISLKEGEALLKKYQHLYLVTLDDYGSKVVTSDKFINKIKLEVILTLKESTKAINWLKKILGNSCFEYYF
jgi:hypothetical protein